MKYKDLIDQMTLEEKCSLLSGRDVWTTRPIERLGIPSIFLSDGPTGVRKQMGAGDHLGLNASVPATCLPTAATMANSWNPELSQEVGRLVGEEAASLDVNVLLGPGLNIKRSPLCGRNFEYFSEDPYLSGKMAAAFVRGVQENGISACPKHFAANSQELRRMANDSVMDERTFREIYLTGFEIAVKDKTLNVSHPGNYTFFDNIQISLGTCGEDACSLRVLATVVSHPSEEFYLFDAGSKCLGLDQGAHGNSAIKGFGHVVGHPELTIVGLSEEVAKVKADGTCTLQIGDRVEIIPNHSCSTANNTGWYTCVRGDEIVDFIAVDARENSKKKGTL